MAEKKITPKNAEQDKAKAKSKKTDTEDQAAGKKATRKVGRYSKFSDRNLKEHIVPVGW